MQSNYWTERAIREKKKALRIAASGNKRMQKQLKATASQINNDIQLFYKKYAQDAGISIAAAKTYLTNKEAGLSYQEYLGLVTEALKGSEHADALLNANLAKQRITRLDALCRQITGRLAVLGGKLENEIGGALLEVGTFEALPYKTLEKLLIADGRWSKRVWGHVEKLDETINKALRDGIAAGASSDVIAKRVQARTGVAMSRCRTLVHTECCYVTESATLDRYIAADVKQYGYLATLDKKTCSGFGGHSCGALDGQVFDVRDAQVGVNYPPMHPNCRCTTYAVFDDGSDEEADFYRVARDENGKNYHVSEKTTYREWKRRQSKEPAPEQNYRKVERGESATFNDVRFKNLKARRISTYDTPVYVSDDATIKPKALHRINKHTEDALKKYGIPEGRKPTIVIVSDNELPTAWGRYDAPTNTVYYVPEIAHKAYPEVPGTTEFHEMYHVKQANDFRNAGWTITEQNYKDYIIELCKREKSKVDKAGITEYNVNEISSYAKKMYDIGRYDEVWTEYVSHKTVRGD